MSRVLIVDDNADTRRLLRRVVARMGHDAECADCGGGALARLAAAPADLVILDVMMPGMSGLEVLRRIRSAPGRAGVRVAMYSATAEPAARAEALACGADEWWPKVAFDLAAIERAIGRLCGPVP